MSAPVIDEAPYSAPNTAAMLEVPLAWLVPSTFNPRRTFSDEALDELAESLRQHGMIEPIVVREVAWPESVQVRNGAGDVCPCYSIIAGERRWRAATRAGLQLVPVRVLADVDDRRALEIAIVENLQRVDLDPIEEAQGYYALHEHADMTQAEIAAAVKRSQPAVAKSLSLLRLPEDVRQLIRDGVLTPSHGHALAAWWTFPRYMQALAQEAIAGHWTSKQMARPGLYVGNTMVQDRILVSVGYTTLFDRTICTQCPFDSYRTDEYGRGYCLRPTHYDDLQDLAKQGQREGLAAALAADAVPRGAPEASTDGMGEDAHQAAVAAPPIPHLQDLYYENYKTFGAAPPAGCSKDCVCRGQAINQRGKVEVICTDPKRYEKLEAAQKRADNRTKRERVREKVATVAAHLQTRDIIDSRELAILVAYAVGYSQEKALLQAAVRQVPGLLPDKGMPSLDDWAKLAPLDLLRVAVDTILTHELQATIEGYGTAPHYVWYERQMSLARKERARGED